MSIIRKRSALHKAYIPSNARDNQYLLAEFPLTDELLTGFNIDISEPNQLNYFNCYQTLSQLLFNLTKEYGINSSIFIANDKLTRVRYSNEMHQWQTAQQILFYYDPQRHNLNNCFFDSDKRAKKITLLFLATGDEIRKGAATFHDKVSKLLLSYQQHSGLQPDAIRLRDHQHITYDLFAKYKGFTGSQAHKFRALPQRYSSQNVNLPKALSAMTYAVVNITIDNRLLGLVDIDNRAKDRYNPLYTHLTSIFSSVAKRFNLNNGALIANGLVPIVRHSLHDMISTIGELQMLGYNPDQSQCGVVSKWQADQLVETVQLIFVATKDNQDEHGFGKFVSQIEQALKLLASELEFSPEDDELIVRFHQHIAYNL